MTEFMAIPVAQGDAFYLRRGEWSALVDGGKSESALPSLFTLHVKTSGVKILVCSHNDADHANGVLGFLKSALICDEVWLPGRWLEALPGVLEPYNTVCVELAKEIIEIPTRLIDGEITLSAIAKGAQSEVETRKDGQLIDAPLELEGNGWPQEYIELLERANETTWGGVLHQFPFPFQYRYYDLDDRQYSLLNSAIDAASRIREIALEAFNRGIKVRWFTFDPTNPGGGVNNLRPVNCREMAPASGAGGASLLMYLALSVANKESLVFRSPGPDSLGDVIFTADSDLAGVSNSLGALNNALVTSPHHGSSANVNAYKKVVNQASSNGTDLKGITWIRSDGLYKKRPGAEYLGVAGKRYCTICKITPSSFSKKTLVKFEFLSNVWSAVAGTDECKCVLT